MGIEAVFLTQAFDYLIGAEQSLEHNLTDVGISPLFGLDLYH